jgi:hypothetical protein
MVSHHCSLADQSLWGIEPVLMNQRIQLKSCGMVLPEWAESNA